MPDLNSSPTSYGIPHLVAEDLYRVRLPLPFKLDHVNVYLARDVDGWTAVDTGVKGPESERYWGEILAFIGGAAQLKTLIITHHHIDHLGMAGWLRDRTACDIVMSADELAIVRQSQGQEPSDRYAKAKSHLTWLGCPPETTETLASQPFRALTFAHPLPDEITLKAPGDLIQFGGREWRLFGGRGHSPSPLMFHDAKGKLLLAGDQILQGISPFVGTFGDAPLASPVRDYLGFLREDIRAIPDDVRVLAGHGDPFEGLHARAINIADHHEERLKHILTACSIEPHSIYSMLAKLFTRSLEGVLPLALAEILAHANLLVDEGMLHASEDAGVRLYRTV